MRRLGFVMLILLGAACVDESIQPTDLRPVNRVVLSAPQAEVLLGDSLRLRAIGLASDGDTLPGRATTWVSSDSGIVSVSPGGYAVGRGQGSVTITATIEGRSDTIPLGGVSLTFTMIGAGADLACGVTTAGSTWCWGSNRAGALGIGDAELGLSRAPRRVSGGLVLTEIAMGYNSSCGLTAAGEVWCWGANGQGQLGNGTTSDQPAPSRVVGGLAFASITRQFGRTYLSSGSAHMCGMTTAQVAYCWGSNGAGQLGDGTRQARSTPVAVQGGHDFVSVTTGGDVTCGLDTGASAWCWGSDVSGRLGHDTSYVNTSPVPVLGGTGFDQIASYAWSGYQVCGVGGGTVRCWGQGPMDYVTHAEPTVMSLPAPMVSIAEGDGYACGLTAAGQAWCWGDNEYGQLGNGSTEWPDLVPPTPVAGGLSFTWIGAGWHQTCGLVASGDVYCWGAGALTTSGNVQTVPELVLGGHSFTTISLAEDHICGLDGAGSAYCWGYNGAGQLGDGSTTDRSTPTLVLGGLTFESVKAGANYSCGVASGMAYCWGDNYYGNLGDGSTTDSSQPVPVAGGHSFLSVWPGYRSTCGLEGGGAAYCWGANGSGQLGDGSTVNSLLPVPVSGGLQFTSITQGGSFACGLTAARTVYCWGDNHFGQLGNGVTTDSPRPVDVQGGFSFVAVEAGGGISCGMTSSGDVYCWPRNGSLPVLVPGGHQFAEVSVGGTHVCGLTTAGAAYCWGRNEDGAFGDGSTNNYGGYYTIPRPVFGGYTFAQISAGWGFTCGITTDGTAYCWGANWSGQVGAALPDGAYQVLTPAKVRGQP